MQEFRSEDEMFAELFALLAKDGYISRGRGEEEEDGKDGVVMNITPKGIKYLGELEMREANGPLPVLEDAYIDILRALFNGTIPAEELS